MILENMISRYKILTYFKNGLTQKGYNFKQLSYINSQIELLDTLIKKESFNVLNTLLREKTHYRLLKQIENGIKNLVEISMYPEQFKLCKIDDCNEEWLNQESLIFSTERETLVFTKNDYEQGRRYINNKWQ